MNDKQILSRAAAIQRYLLSRPESADTLEDIHQSWIRSRGSDDGMELTRAALDYLKAAGFIESAIVSDREMWRRAAGDGPSGSDMP
jgi:acyl-CoA thioesterase